MQALKSTWRHVRRSPYQAFSAIFIMTQTFFVISFFTFLIFGSAKIIAYFESLPQISVFFRQEAKQEQIDALKNQLFQTGKIANIHFVSKQEALRIYQQQNKDDPLLLDLVSANILPPSFNISTHKVTDLAIVAGMLKGLSIVDKVIFQTDVIAKLISWTNALRQIGFVLIIVLGLDSIFIMVIITGIRISQRKEEIEILKLLGATNWYIRWPFLFEGMLYGLIGAFFGWLFAVGILWYTMPILESFLGSISIFPVPTLFLLELLGAELLLAIVLGIFSGSVAVLRYLK